MLKNGASLSEILSYTKNAYLELQFHGELTMSDVKYIVFKSESAYKNSRLLSTFLRLTGRWGKWQSF